MPILENAPKLKSEAQQKNKEVAGQSLPNCRLLQSMPILENARKLKSEDQLKNKEVADLNKRLDQAELEKGQLRTELAKRQAPAAAPSAGPAPYFSSSSAFSFKGNSTSTGGHPHGGRRRQRSSSSYCRSSPKSGFIEFFSYAGYNVEKETACSGT